MSLAFLFAATRSERKEEEDDDERVLLASLRLEDIDIHLLAVGERISKEGFSSRSHKQSSCMNSVWVFVEFNNWRVGRGDDLTEVTSIQCILFGEQLSI